MTKLIRNAFRVSDTSNKSNWLRAAVLGSNDGIISIAGLVIGVSEAAQSKDAVLAAGIAGIVAGVISMAVGEYISVRTQRDMEEASLSQERLDLADYPKEELEDLVSAYEKEGLEPNIAETVAKEFTQANAFMAHAETDFHIDPNHLTNPWKSVIASSIAFIASALIPLSAIMLSNNNYAILVVFTSVILALIVTGTLTARVSGTSTFRSTLRIVIGGTIAMIVTYVAGVLFRVAGV